MIYVCVECPKCGQENEVDETLKSFYCLKCGVKCDLEYESIYEPEEDAPKAPITSSGEEAEKRLKRAYLFMEDGDWAHAWSYCESVLDYDPENAEAYLAELLISLRLHSFEELKTCKVNCRDHSLYKKAMRFATDEQRLMIESAQQFQGRVAKYKRAKSYLESASNPGGSITTKQYLLREAIDLFDSLGSFEDSKELAAQCRQLIGSI